MILIIFLDMKTISRYDFNNSTRQEMILWTTDVEDNGEKSYISIIDDSILINYRADNFETKSNLQVG